MLKVDPKTKRKIKRELVSRQKEAVDISQQADDQIERLLIKRMGRLVAVRRFIFLWSLLFVVLFLTTFLQFRALSRYYEVLQPVPGGLYSEGVVGTFTNANPLYATGTADTAVSRLVFSGLFKYDTKNQLTGDLASSWNYGADSKQYIVHLRHGVTWHDGQPFTADDVVFTYDTIQNIEAQSSLYSSWQGITVKKVDTYTVSFELPNSLSSFPQSLTNGIVPKHLLKNIPPEQLRSAPFNTDPVGTGPFLWKYVQVNGTASEDREQRIAMAAFDNYWDGRPRLDGFSLVTFADDQHLIAAFDAKQLNAISGLETVPPQIAKDSKVEVYVTPTTSAVMAFFNNSQPVLKDANVRKALVSAVDTSKIYQLSNQPLQKVDSPLLRGQLGYDPSITQLPYNQKSASDLLDKAGWTMGPNGYRVKDGKTLEFSLTTQDTHDYVTTASFLQKQWKKIGVKVDATYYDADDLQTQAISNHNYDILLYAVSIGADPDVFAYWDSSQASITSQGHLNLSEYKSSTADQALEGGRTRSDSALRVAKYKAFLKSWQQDAPALALYQPNFIYISHGPIFYYERKADNSAADRFYNVNKWMIRQKKQQIQ